MKPRINSKLIIALFIIALVIAIPIFIYNLNLSTVIIQVAPANATVSINGKSYQNGIYKIPSKSQAEITVSAEDFEPKSFTLDLNRQQVAKIFTYLIPTGGDWRYYEQADNRESLSIMLSNSGYLPWSYQKVGSNLTNDQDESVESLAKKLSIKSVAPVQFSICGEPANRLNCNAISIDYDYYPECDNFLCLEISSRTEKLDQETLGMAKNELLKQGFNLNDYQYFYTFRDN